VVQPAWSPAASRSSTTGPSAIHAFHVHSRWTDEAAFDRHADLPHTVRFIGRMERAIDQPMEVSRARPID